MDEERKLGLIPQVRIPGALGVNIYAILITTRRLLFIRTSKGYGFILGGAVGAAIGSYYGDKGTRPFTDPAILRDIDINTLKEEKGNKDILIDNITKVKLKKGLAANKLSIYGLKKNKKKLLLEGYLVPPSGYTKGYKEEGLDSKEISLRYIQETESIFQTVLLDRIERNY
ncbi:MAG: hypothetical protein JSW00_14455 [Thermoplasmata archaeon]|nr:MAG: hypothetical protein JSW00_14455 [Thermoplasmata archaeon]